MALPSLSGSSISSTYNRLVQTDGSIFADGTGSIIPSLNITSSTAITASYALTASFLENAIPPFPYTGSAVITGSLNVIGPFTASSTLITGNVVVLGTASINTLVVNQTKYSSGSNQLGDAADDTQTFFGTVVIPTGSLSVTGSTFLSGSVFVENIKPSFDTISIGNAGTDYLLLGVKNPNNLYPFSQYHPFPGIGIYSLDTIASSTRGSVIVSYNSGSSIGNFQVWSVDDDGNRTERLVVSNQGNLGIGTNNPTSKLDVNGTGRFTNNLIVSGGVIISGSGVTGLALEVDGLTRFYGNILAPGLTTISNVANKTLYYDQDNGEIYVGPTFTESDTLDTVTTRGNTTNNDITVGNLTSSTVRITDGLTVTGSLNISGSLTSSQDIQVNTMTVGQGVINDFNVAIGYSVLDSNVSGGDNVAIGNNALTGLVTGRRNVAIGYETMVENTTGVNNVALGHNSLAFNSIGRDNVSLGAFALESNRSGSYNAGIGPGAISSPQNGSYNSGVGYYALGNRFYEGSYNIGLGYLSADYFNTGSWNVFLGHNRAGFATGSFNSIVGGNIPAGILPNELNKSVVLADQSGSIRLFSPENGNIGIGTLNPNSKLHVIGEIKSSVSASNYAFQIENSNEPEFKYRIFNHGSTAGTLVITSGLFYNTIENASIRFIRGGGAQDGTVAFATNGNNERMRITSTGNVLIGTTNQDARFQVRGSGTTSATTSFRVENSSNVARLTVLDDGTSAFNTNTLFISGSGNVGISTTSPTNRFQVINDSVTNASNINALNNNSNNYATQGIVKVESVNNALYMGVSSTVNDPRSWIQSGHEISAFAGGVGSIALNPVGGNVGVGIMTPTSKLHVRGLGTTTSTTTFLLQNSTPTTLLSVLDNGQTLFTGPSSTLANGVAQFNISQSLIQTAVTNSVIDAVRISPTLQTTATNQTQTALKVQATFTGSFTGSQNVIADFGATSVGSQLTVTDITSGSIYMVNDVSGLPIIEATSDWSVRMYNFPQTVFEKTGSNVNIYGTLNATGSFILPLSQSTTPVVGSAYWSGSLLFVYDGTRYRSSSFA